MKPQMKNPGKFINFRIQLSSNIKSILSLLKVVILNSSIGHHDGFHTILFKIYKAVIFEVK